MATFEVDVEGVTYEVDAPDENTAWTWANQTHQQEMAAQPKAAPAQQQEETPFLESIGLSSNPSDYLRQVGLTARAGLEGLGASGPMFGLPQPQNEQERIALAANRGAVGATALGKGGQLLAKGTNLAAQKIGELLSRAPVSNLALGQVSGAASQVAAEEGVGPMGQTVAGIAAPVAAGYAANAVVRPVATKLGNIVHNTFAPKGGTLAAGRVATDVAGKETPAVVQSIRNADPSLTAGQAAVPAGRAEFQGLERIVGRKVDPSSFGKRHGTVAKNFEAMLDAEQKALNARLFPSAERVLNAVEQAGGVNTRGVVQNLDAVLADKSQAANKSVTGVVNYVKSQLDALPPNLYDPNTGTINPHTLYGIRKNLGLDWKKMADAEGWDKKQAARAIRQAQDWIDEAIIAAEQRAAGTQTWKTDYLEPFSKGMKILEKLRATPKISAQMGEEGVTAARNIANLDAPEISFSNFLSRPIMITNAVLRKMQGYGSERTMKELARLMKPENKAELAKLMEEEFARRAAREPWKQTVPRAALIGTGVSGLNQ